MSDGRLTRFSYEGESQGDRLARKSKEAPIFPVGKYTTKQACKIQIYT